MYRFRGFHILLAALLFTTTEGKPDSVFNIDISSSPCDGEEPVYYIMAELFEEDIWWDDFYTKERCDKTCVLRGDGNDNDGLLYPNQEWYIQFRYRCKDMVIRKACIDLALYNPTAHSDPELLGEHEIKVDFKDTAFSIDG